MSIYEELNKYIIDENTDDVEEQKRILKYPHNIYKPHKADLNNSYSQFFSFPYELKIFYEQVGYGFFNINKSIVNRLLDPVSFVLVNTGEYIYYQANEVDIYRNIYNLNEKLIFFQSDNHYLAIDRVDKNNKNRIFFKDYKISDSLYQFIDTICSKRNYLKTITNIHS